MNLELHFCNHAVYINKITRERILNKRKRIRIWTIPDEIIKQISIKYYGIIVY